MSANKPETVQLSVYISNFCKLIADSQKSYAWHHDEVNRLDKLTQDYLHKLELEGLNYKERAKVATQLMRCRQLRRVSKDAIEVLEPLINFVATDKGKGIYNMLREVIGQTRKVEEHIDNRSYRYKVLETDLENK